MAEEPLPTDSHAPPMWRGFPALLWHTKKFWLPPILLALLLLALLYLLAGKSDVVAPFVYDL